MSIKKYNTTEVKISVVTGANRGLGLETYRQLAKQSMKIILTSRSEEKGRVAAQKLQAERLDVTYSVRCNRLFPRAPAARMLVLVAFAVSVSICLI